MLPLISANQKLIFAVFYMKMKSLHQPGSMNGEQSSHKLFPIVFCVEVHTEFNSCLKTY